MSVYRVASVGKLWGLVIVALVAACSDPAKPIVSVDAGVADAPVSRIPDGAVICDADEDCDDGIDCTDDSCEPLGYCAVRVDNESCSDGVFCNGSEQCDPERGCRPGPRETCNDGDVCTIDSCDEEGATCLHGPRDFDGDGEADWHCAGGTDCDDSDPDRGATLAEICVDSVDNDCDGFTDESECGAPRYDDCDDPLDVSAGGVFTLDTVGFGADYASSCGSTGWSDAVFAFTLAEAKSVLITTSGGFASIALSLRTECTNRTSEITCDQSYPSTLRVRQLVAGTYYVLVQNQFDDEVDVDVTFGDPLGPIANEACEGATLLEPGVTLATNIVDATDDAATSCGGVGLSDLLFAFTVPGPERSNVDVTVNSDSESYRELTVAAASTCGDALTELRCSQGQRNRLRLYDLEPGTYYVTVEADEGFEPDFTIRADFSTGTPPPAGDTCSTALPIAMGEPILGSLDGFQDDAETSCGFDYADTVYALVLEGPADVLVEVDSSTYLSVALQTECGVRDTELRCVSGTMNSPRFRALGPGTYYLVIESSRAAAFSLVVALEPASDITTVSGNDVCSTAYEVPETGGVFTGSMGPLLPDLRTSMCGFMASGKDCAFRLELSTTKVVRASTEGSSFDTVLHLHTTSCASGLETACDDDSGDGNTSVLERTLAPGTYFFIVDAYSSSVTTDYIFELSVTDP